MGLAWREIMETAQLSAVSSKLSQDTILWKLKQKVEKEIVLLMSLCTSGAKRPDSAGRPGLQGRGHSAYRPGVPVVFRAEQHPSTVLQGSSFYKNCTFLKVQRSGFPLWSNAEPIPSPPGSAAIEQDLPFDRPPLLRPRFTQRVTANIYK